MLCHGCVAWWPRVEIGTARKALDKLQRLAGLCITVAINSTPTRALETILSLSPLDIYIKSVAFNASESIVNNGWWTVTTSIGHSRIRSLIKEAELSMPKDIKKESIIPHREEWLGESKIWPPTEGIVCYTDGSKNEFLSVVGYHCEHLNIKNHLSTGQYASITQLKIYAVSEICITASLIGGNGKHMYRQRGRYPSNSVSSG